MTVGSFLVSRVSSHILSGSHVIVDKLLTVTLSTNKPLTPSYIMAIFIYSVYMIDCYSSEPNCWVCIVLNGYKHYGCLIYHYQFGNRVIGQFVHFFLRAGPVLFILFVYINKLCVQYDCHITRSLRIT